MADEINRRGSEVSKDGTVATLHVQEFDVHGGAPDITMTFRGAEGDPEGRPSVVRVEISSADAELLLGALLSEVTRPRQHKEEGGINPAGVVRADSQSGRAAKITHPGVHYTELGWTRDQFEEAVEDMSDLKDIWDHDELDVYNDLLKG